jgi:hypothetical protein
LFIVCRKKFIPEADASGINPEATALHDPLKMQMSGVLRP